MVQKTYAFVDSSIERDVLKLNLEFTQQRFTHFSKSYTLYYNFVWPNSGWGATLFFSPYKAGELLCAYEVETEFNQTLLQAKMKATDLIPFGKLFSKEITCLTNN